LDDHILLGFFQGGRLNIASLS